MIGDARVRNGKAENRETSGVDMADRTNRCWSQVSLSAIGKNIRAIRRVAAGASVWAVVKADAYGHGVLETAGLLANSGVDAFCVATLPEAVQLREAGFTRQSVLLLGSFYADEISDLIQYSITPTIPDMHHLGLLSRHCRRKNQTIDAELKVDSGMNRYGIRFDELTERAQEIFRTPGVNITALYSHLAASGVPDDPGTHEQIALFRRAVDYLEISNLWFGRKHICNSGGVLYYRDALMDAVRPGLILYGYYPGAIDRETLPLTPALSLHARVTAVKKVFAGGLIGYDRTYSAKREMTIALVSIGYADGYPVRFSNRGTVLLGRERCPVVGKVCMDTTMIHVPSGRVKPGDEVVLWGGRDLPLETVAADAGTIPYELVCQISRRVPRFHVD